MKISKKLLLIILLGLGYNISYSQKESEYDIFLILDSSKKEMITSRSENGDFISFIVSKPEEKRPNYSLLIDENGKLQKFLRGTSSWGCCSMTMVHCSKLNKQKKILKIKSTINIITYKDFMDIFYDNFLEILGSANKVYVIDSSKNKNEFYYLAYEVTINKLQE